MNKLYAFLAIGILSACGSSGIDGSWSYVKDADITMEITGDEAYITNSGDLAVTCPIEGPDQDVYTLVCNDEGFEFFVYLRLDDGILKVVIDDEVRNFVRK
tara:strand:- start:887 stop:1189 length:303 start_codon:yes stop_codon:yes gene_type:complete